VTRDLVIQSCLTGNDGAYAVVGSLGGAPTHPVRVHNLCKNPRVELQDRREKHDYLAHEVVDDERDLWLQ
jgi:F420H(2)-dependent quinone reductase